MLCECGGRTLVADTRQYDGMQLRKRKCKNCNKSFYTKEIRDEETENLFKEYMKISKMGYRDKKKVEDLRNGKDF